MIALTIGLLVACTAVMGIPSPYPSYGQAGPSAQAYALSGGPTAGAGADPSYLLGYGYGGHHGYGCGGGGGYYGGHHGYGCGCDYCSGHYY